MTKLNCTNIEDPASDLDVVKHKLVGRDELEIRMLKQIREEKKRTSESSEDCNEQSDKEQLEQGAGECSSTT